MDTTDENKSVDYKIYKSMLGGLIYIYIAYKFLKNFIVI
jgi:hypothetical protein